jgi:uncharacterized protein YjbI with pentapeptide repeats
VRSHLYLNHVTLNLQIANLTGLDLRKLIGVNLKEANLSSASLIEANLSDADLTGTNLYRANLLDAQMTEINISEAKLNATIMPDGTIDD